MDFKVPGSFKIWIIAAVATILCLSFGLGIYAFKKNIERKNLEQLYSKNVIKNKNISFLIRKRIKSADKTLSEISLLYGKLSKEGFGSTREILNRILSFSIGESKDYQFSYYDKNMKYYKLSNAENPFDQSGDIGSNKLFANANITNGDYYFLCKYFCQIFIIRSLDPHNLNKGFIQIGISVDSIVDDIVNNSHKVDVIIYKEVVAKNNKETLMVRGKNYEYELSTKSHLKNTLQKKLSINEKPFIIHDQGKKIIFNYELWKGIVLFASEDITPELNNSAREVEKFIINSAFVLIFVLFVFYFLMTLAMRRIKNLGFIFELITKSDFNTAKDCIRKSKRIKNYDEIDNMYTDLYYLTDELESTLLELDVKNKQLLMKFEESLFLADHDSMTGLINRRRFTLELDRAFEQESSFSLVSADLNHFKLVNDSLGHAAGDRLLIDSANIISSVVGEHGIAARMGGDEFSIIIYHRPNIHPLEILLHISKKIKTISPGNNFGIKISMSMGVAIFPDDSSDMDELSSFSDIAMYENKRLKLDDFHCYNGTETLVQEEREAQVWQNLISTHLKENTFSVFFQAIIDYKNKKVFSHEVLARIIDKKTIYRTDKLIIHAEKNRKIIQIDQYVFKRALRLATKAGRPKINVNLSYVTISTPGVCEFILSVVSECKYPCENIIFEITETQEMSNIRLAAEFISRMKRYNFSFALDDFGSGFSSFYYLAKLGVSYIKIDKSIIYELLVTSDSHHVVKSIVSLANDLKISVIAEGIETVEVLNILNKYNINLFQGYYFSRPRAAMHTNYNKMLGRSGNAKKNSEFDFSVSHESSVIDNNSSQHTVNI